MRKMPGLTFLCVVISTFLIAAPAIAQQVIATVPTDLGPIAVGVNAATNKIYVANISGSDVTVINGFTLHTATVPVGAGPFIVAVDDVTNIIYVANQLDGTVTVLNGSNNNTSTVEVGDVPYDMAVNPVTNKIYTVNNQSDDVTVIDGVTQKTTSVDVGLLPVAVAVNTVTNKIYVANYCGNDPNCESLGTVTVVDGVTLETTTVNVGANPDAIAVNPLTNQVYVANYCGTNPTTCPGPGTVTVIDGNNNNSTSTLTAGNSPDVVVVNPVTNQIYVANQGDGTVTAINGGTDQTTVVTVGKDPVAAAVDPVTNKIYVANSESNTVTMIDANNNNKTTTVAVGNQPSAIGINSITNRIYVANTSDNTVSVIAGANASPLQFVSVPPCRLVDTRGSNGEFGGPPIQGGTSRSFPIPQQTSCNIPATAAAYSLNVTVVPITTLGYLTIWPTGEDQPVVSTMNSTDGRVKANAAIVPAGYQGAVSVYVTDTTNVILDIDGYFTAPGSETYQFYPLTPCRLVDTRGADGGLGGPRLAAQTPRSFPLLESSCIPAGLNPLAYSLNFTVVPNPSGQPLGYLSVWPTGESQPVVSTLNNPTATVVANAAIVPAGTNGAIDVYAYDTTDLLVDIDGYFAAPGTGGLSMYPGAPCRVLDTRQNNGQPFSGELTVNVVGSVCAPPSTAQAYIFNATVVPPGSMPYLTLWPDGEQQPTVSTLNAYDGFITSNMAIVPTTNGSIDAYAYALTQLILDISGYFAP
jgi:YVTN family beta-propeller protein